MDTEAPTGKPSLLSRRTGVRHPPSRAARSCTPLYDRPMLRLTGLPPVASAPRVRVALVDERLVLRFRRVDGSVTRFDLPLYTYGDDADGEHVQLSLLARLLELGYDAEPEP